VDWRGQGSPWVVDGMEEVMCFEEIEIEEGIESSEDATLAHVDITEIGNLRILIGTTLDNGNRKDVRRYATHQAFLYHNRVPIISIACKCPN
jgi:hypothetical protein